MGRRLILVALVGASLVGAPSVEAKLIPTLDKRLAAPGDKVVVEFGAGIEHYLAPLEVYLVSSRAEPTLTGRRDSRLRLVGRLGVRGRTILSHRLTFRVPPLPAGRYTLAVYFRGTATGRWHNLLEGLSQDASFRDGLMLRIVRRR